MMLPFLGLSRRETPCSFSEFFQLVLATFLSKDGLGYLDFHAL
jgi:hypothetical protein